MVVSDFQCTETFHFATDHDVECLNGYVKCEGSSPNHQCVPESWLCDGDNDCVNDYVNFGYSLATICSTLFQCQIFKLSPH